MSLYDLGSCRVQLCCWVVLIFALWNPVVIVYFFIGWKVCLLGEEGKWHLDAQQKAADRWGMALKAFLDLQSSSHYCTIFCQCRWPPCLHKQHCPSSTSIPRLRFEANALIMCNLATTRWHLLVRGTRLGIVSYFATGGNDLFNSREKGIVEHCWQNRWRGKWYNNYTLITEA